MAKRLAAASLCAVLSLSSPAAAGRTTVTVLEIGPGAPTVHRTTSPDAAVPASAVASLWGALHPATGRKVGGRRGGSAAGTAPGMPLSSDPLASPDAGLVVGLSGPYAGDAAREVLRSAAAGGARAVGTVAVSGRDAHRDLMEAAGAAGPGPDGAGLVRALGALESSGKSVVVHLVVEGGEEGKVARRRRRLDEQQEEGEGDQEGGDQQQQSSSSTSSGYKTMYEIQTYNLYLWTSVGLVVILSMVMGAFVDMRLFPDTLLHGAVTKVAD